MSCEERLRIPRIEIKPNVDPLTDRELVLIKVHLQTLSDMSKGKEYKAVVNMESIVFKLHGSEQKSDKIRFKCGVCKLETSDDDLTDLYMGMGVTQYICVECQKLSFRLVMRRLGEHESPAYVGDTPLEEVQSSEKTIRSKTDDVLDDALIKLVEGTTKMSCLCGEEDWIVDSGDESLEDCDLMEKRLCNNCGREYETKYQLISFNEMSEVTGWKAIGRHKEPHQTEYSVDVVHVPSSVKEPKDGICSYCEMGELEPYSGRVYYGYRGSGIVGAKHIDLENAQKCSHCGAYVWEEGI